MSSTPDSNDTQTPEGEAPPPAERTELEERLGTKPQKPGLAHRIASVWKDEYDTAMNWPRGKRHLLMRGLTVLIVNTIALLLVGEFMNGIQWVGSFWSVVLSAALVTLVAGGITFVVRPVVFVALGINNVIVTAVLTVVFMGLTLLVASWLVEGIVIDGFLVAFIASILIAAINTVLVGIIGLDEDESFFRHSMKRMARVSGDVDDRPGPGFVILQIDGLAEPILRDALRTGYMPFLNDWLSEGTHRLGKYEALAPSMTSAGPGGHPPRRPAGHPGLPLVGEGTQLPHGLEPSRGRLRDRATSLATRATCCAMVARASATSCPVAPPAPSPPTASWRRRARGCR